MQYIACWLVVTILGFIAPFCDRSLIDPARFTGRTRFLFFNYYMELLGQGYRSMVLHYFGTHCPWSWERAKRFRIDHMRNFLEENGELHHAKLGPISLADCSDTRKQDEIARICAVSRLRAWADGLVSLFVAPFRGVLFLMDMMTDAAASLR